MGLCPGPTFGLVWKERETKLVINKYLAEFLGTFILVVGGSLAILSMGGAAEPAQVIGIGLGFGLALLAGIWVVGHVSGAHFNPAVTLAFLADRRMSLSDAIGYWIAQIAGAVVASLVVLMASSQAAVAGTATGYSQLSTAIVVEIVLTAIFVWTIMAAVKQGQNHAPLAIALVLVGVHVAGVPLSGASVNPARSFGPAIVGGDASQLAVYIYAPLIGGLLAWGLYRLFPAGDDAS